MQKGGTGFWGYLLVGQGWFLLLGSQVVESLWSSVREISSLGGCPSSWRLYPQILSPGHQCRFLQVLCPGSQGLLRGSVQATYTRSFLLLMLLHGCQCQQLPALVQSWKESVDGICARGAVVEAVLRAQTELLQLISVLLLLLFHPLIYRSVSPPPLPPAAARALVLS